MQAYDELVDRVRDGAVRDSQQGTQELPAIVAQALHQLPELVATGSLSPPVLAAVSAELLSGHIPRSTCWAQAR
jgi:hypothetical protein